MRNIKAKSTDRVSEAGQQIINQELRETHFRIHGSATLIELAVKSSLPSFASWDFTESFPIHLKAFVPFFSRTFLAISLLIRVSVVTSGE